MILRYYGHSLFTLALECGVTLLTDPYGDFFDYPRQRLQADIVTISHHHHDHDAISMVAGNAVVLDQPGGFTPAPGLRVTGIPGWHDTQNGAQRGNNLMFVIETEGLRIVHMGKSFWKLNITNLCRLISVIFSVPMCITRRTARFRSTVSAVVTKTLSDGRIRRGNPIGAKHAGCAGE